MFIITTPGYIFGFIFYIPFHFSLLNMHKFAPLNNILFIAYMKTRNSKTALHGSRTEKRAFSILIDKSAARSYDSKDEEKGARRLRKKRTRKAEKTNNGSGWVQNIQTAIL